MTGFEGSFLGATDKISRQAVMECKICWTPYDPADGDETRGVDPGTAFVDLPEDWSCPNCSSPREQFLVNHDPGSVSAATAKRIDTATKALEAEFREIWNAKMRDVPMVNAALHVEAVGFQPHGDDGRLLGVLLSPWFMNLVLLPAEAEDWSALVAGEKEVVAFPSGDYEFIHNARGALGGYKACSLFSMMGEFKTQAAAVEVAHAIMAALFDDENRAETDRAADIRAAREADLAEAAAAAEATEAAESTDSTAADDADATAAPIDPTPTRRQVLTGGLATPTEAG